MDPKLLEIRRRLLDDFAYYAPAALKIRTKAGEVVPFQFNAAQKRLSDAVNQQYESEKRVRVIILKARQMGLSTYVGGRLYFRVSQRQAKKAIVVTHHADSTRALFDMTKRFHDQCPEALRPSTRYSSRRELQFDRLDSGYTVATAGGDAIGRGETFTHAHLSELGFWPRSSAAENFNGLMQAIPNTADTEIYIESTGNGVSGLFYDTWHGAVRGENGFVPVFLPWFIDRGYREAVPAGFERTPEEKELVKLFKLNNGQLMFRRRKIAQNGLELFQQEYPATADEAFLTTGRPVFHPGRIAEMLRSAREPVARLALEGARWETHPRGELACFLPHDPAETYYIGADVGMGVQRDWSVAQVFDSAGRQAAVFRAQVDPDYFATVLYHLGKFFNEAKIVPESNNHGILTCVRLAKDLGYPNVYQEVIYDKIMDTETVRIGFSTNVKSKPLVIDKLRAKVRDSEIEVYDRTTLEEMRSFVVTETGSMESERGCHDDTVMALALCNHINEGVFTPIRNDEGWYVKTE